MTDVSDAPVKAVVWDTMIVQATVWIEPTSDAPNDWMLNMSRATEAARAAFDLIPLSHLPAPGFPRYGGDDKVRCGGGQHGSLASDERPAEPHCYGFEMIAEVPSGRLATG